MTAKRAAVGFQAATTDDDAKRTVNKTGRHFRYQPVQSTRRTGQMVLWLHHADDAKLHGQQDGRQLPLPAGSST